MSCPMEESFVQHGIHECVEDGVAGAIDDADFCWELYDAAACDHRHGGLEMGAFDIYCQQQLGLALQPREGPLVGS